MADALATEEIEITPAMIAAGIAELRLMSGAPERDIVDTVFAAMIAASRAEGDGVRSSRACSNRA
jgi:hypothetical protein